VLANSVMEAPYGTSITGISGGGNLSSRLWAEAHSEVSWVAGPSPSGLVRRNQLVHSVDAGRNSEGATCVKFIWNRGQLPVELDSSNNWRDGHALRD
jgi:hypothetical protein